MTRSVKDTGSASASALKKLSLAEPSQDLSAAISVAQTEFKKWPKSVKKSPNRTTKKPKNGKLVE